jgi:hypothetical protein
MTSRCSTHHSATRSLARPALKWSLLAGRRHRPSARPRTGRLRSSLTRAAEAGRKGGEGLGTATAGTVTKTKRTVTNPRAPGPR